jgi:hypothetical protein
MSTIPRKELKKQFERLGATVKDQVSSKTDMLIVGVDRGHTKYQSALRKGVPIIPWPIFVDLGLFEERGKRRLSVDNELLGTVLLNMVTVTDSCYAHFVTRRDLRFYRAWLLGRTAVVRLLRGAWGPPVGGDERDGDDLFGSPCQDSFNCLSGSFSCWLKLLELIQGE